MAQEIKQGNIFGRLGSGIGQGLAEQLPKEIERNRLSNGLKELGKNGANLTPFQRFTQLAATPGITPQMIESGSELLKHEGVRSAYANKARGRQQDNQVQSPNANALKDIQFANGIQGRQQQQEPGRQQQPIVKSEEFGQPQIVDKNPLRPEAQPAKPWTPQQRDQDISKVLEENPNATLQEAVQISADNERRALAMPAAERALDDRLKEVEQEADDEFTKQLELKLQKNKEGVFEDITGENINHIKRSIARDLRTNPKSTIKDVVNYWSDKALNLAKTKSQLKPLANRDLLDKYSPAGNESTYNKLKSYQKIFSETGNSEEYFNKLKEDFKLSPQGAASIAYPLNENLKKYTRNKTNSNTQNIYQNSVKDAVEISKLITSSDSLLSIAKELRMKDPLFDQRAFFNQLREDQDNLGLTPRQQRELAEGESSVLPYWMDIWLLPTRIK